MAPRPEGTDDLGITTTALAFLLMPGPERELGLMREWLGHWRGVGTIATEMATRGLRSRADGGSTIAGARASTPSRRRRQRRRRSGDARTSRLSAAYRVSAKDSAPWRAVALAAWNALWRPRVDVDERPGTTYARPWT